VLSLVGHSWVKLSPTQNLPTWYLVWSVVRIGLNQWHTRWTMQVSTPVCWSGDYPLTGSLDVLWSNIRRICGTYWSVKAVRDSISTFTVQNIKQPIVQQSRFEFRVEHLIACRIDFILKMLSLFAGFNGSLLLPKYHRSSMPVSV